jgi:hypothetical protein
LTQYILASDHLASVHRDLLLLIQKKEDSDLLRRVIADFDSLETVAGADPEGWIIGTWVNGSLEDAEQSFYAVRDLRAEEGLLAARPVVTVERLPERLRQAREQTRQLWGLKLRPTAQTTTARFTAGGRFSIQTESGEPVRARWWWDGRYIRLDRFTDPEDRVEILPAGMLINDHLEPRIFLQRARP